MKSLVLKPNVSPAEFVRMILSRLEKNLNDVDSVEISGAWYKLRVLAGSDPEIEREYIKGCKLFFNYDIFYFPEAIGNPEIPWYQHPVSIARGEYPLQLLPEHLRDLAKSLYYQ